jgi:hypothetical protein
LRPHEIDRLLAESRYREILHSRGAFVLVATDGAHTRIITSCDVGRQAYYAVAGGRLFWGHSVEDVVEASRIPFEWNHEAVANYLIFDHTLGDETLHSRVLRTSPGTILSFDGSVLNVQSPQKEHLGTSRHSGLDVNELRDRVVDYWKDAPGLLCLTAGMDSRLLLAMLLSAGIRPDLLIAGQSESFDVKVAADIARAFDLRSLRCEVKASDFLKHADVVTRASSGGLPVSHWPGSLIAAHGAGSSLMLGFGGEAMRSYYDDEGIASFLRSVIPKPSSAAVRLLRRNVWIVRRLAAEKGVAPPLAAQLATQMLLKRTLRICCRHSCVGDALDGFYRTQHLANKTVLDLSVMSRFASWSAPLLSSDWLGHADRTARWRKLGSIFHRRAIAQLTPELQDFPEELAPTGKMTKWPPRTYFTRKIPRITHFVDQGVYVSGQVGELVQWADSGLNDVIAPGMLTSLWASSEGRALGLKLAALGLWKRTLD